LKDQNLDGVTPIQFKDHWLIPIRKEIKKLFGEKEIEFLISVKANKIIIESPTILEDLDLQYNNQLQDVINVL